MTLRLLADDLTGALDSAAAFCGGGAVCVFLAPPPVLPAGPAAIDLGCRDGSEAAAVAATAAAAPLLAGAGIAFLKIDSLLRGHWAAMLAALWRRGGFRHCVFAPAFPAQGRVTRQGRQFLREADGTLRPVTVDPRAALAAQGVTEIAVQDAAVEAELRAVVARGRALSGPVLWCGTAGLAMALADQPPPVVTRLPAPALAVIGSNHAVALAQLRTLADASGTAPLRLRGADGEVAEVSARLCHPGCVVQADIPAGTAPDAAAARIAALLRATLPRLARPATLIAAGGETLRSACEALGVARLDVDGAMAPGVPCSRLVGGVWDGVRVVSKSGAFGAPDLLARLFAAVAAL
ncbi:MAG: hypothetical protein M0Z28_24790 [Rhodospirillales bacterium]|nr:hypothetical protein [Rhodospirillales bacterium]